MPWREGLVHRSVFDEVYKFCGWNKLHDLLEDCPTNETRLIVLTLFKTGARISECLTIERRQVDLEGEWVNIHMLPVLKYKTKNKVFRDVVFPIDEPLTDVWFSLMPGDGKFFRYKYDKYYKDICRLQVPEGQKRGPWFPHAFRSLRARQLMEEYGFGVTHLQKFFRMASTDTPVEYVKPHIQDLKMLMKKGVEQNGLPIH